MENKKVLLGMSGGVDSSVSALLLKKEGYDVIGITLELFAGSSCCNIETYIDAKNVCNSIGIPHFTYDCKEQFRKHVIQDFIEYQNKGIIFDAANGTNHFSLRVAECCMNQGFLPDIISTDLTIKSLYIPGKVFSLA